MQVATLSWIIEVGPRYARAGDERHSDHKRPRIFKALVIAVPLVPWRRPTAGGPPLADVNEQGASVRPP
jgi:hypothetical protein